MLKYELQAEEGGIHALSIQVSACKLVQMLQYMLSSICTRLKHQSSGKQVEERYCPLHLVQKQMLSSIVPRAIYNYIMQILDFLYW